MAQYKRNYFPNSKTQEETGIDWCLSRYDEAKPKEQCACAGTRFLQKEADREPCKTGLHLIHAYKLQVDKEQQIPTHYVV